MQFKGWPEILIHNDAGQEETAKAPLIISASRATDIPAFYSNWFFNRLEKGHVKWINPFNGKATYVSFHHTRAIVFWTKNPGPVIPFLHYLDSRNINYYFLFTLNDYEKEGFEPHVPILKKRIETFKKLSEKIGRKRVLWRFDPLLQTPEITPSELIHRIQYIGDQTHPFTDKLIFSFAQISCYKKVQRNLIANTDQFKREDITMGEFTNEQKHKVAEKIGELASRWNIQAASCAEEIDLTAYGIKHNKCIDDELMRRIFPEDKTLLHFLNTGEPIPSSQKSLFKAQGNSVKDPGQRNQCGCIPSKDIGKYNTCPHLCVYCYANSNRRSTLRNFHAHNPNAETIC